MDDWPFWFLLTFLFVGAMVRGQAIYWLARWVTEQALARSRPHSPWVTRVHTWLAGEGPERGRIAIERGGLVVVPLAYLTVGFQSLVMAGAGMMRMRWLAFTLAQVPGALAWGLIYATIGFAVWATALSAAAGSPWALAALVALSVVVVATLLSRRIRSRRQALREQTPVP